MFNLNQAIKKWRQEMLAAGVKNPEALDELEIHLREEIRSLASAGASETEAFRLAAGRVGNPGAVAVEFEKSKSGPSLPVILGSTLWTGISVVLAAVLFRKWFDGRLGFLLLAHIFTLTAGYIAAFLTGGLGICYVGFRWFGMASPVRCRALRRAVFLFSAWAAGLVLAGLITGMIWSARNRGQFMTGDPRAIGPLFAAMWLVTFWLVQRSGRMRDHATLLLAIGGNMIVSFAWFGAGVLAQGFAPLSYWPLDILLAVHLVFLALGIVSRPEMADAWKHLHV
jgi:hypothetical protein